MAVGKLVRGALYVHREAVSALRVNQKEKVALATSLATGARWNVVRIAGDVVALLEYQDFDTAAFPRLLASVRINLASGEKTVTDFRLSVNPPILHRKEQLLNRQDAQTARWRETTRRLVDMGLFKDSGAIGRQKAWVARLEAAGLTIIGDEVLTR